MQSYLKKTQQRSRSHIYSNFRLLRGTCSLALMWADSGAKSRGSFGLRTEWFPNFRNALWRNRSHIDLSWKSDIPADRCCSQSVCELDVRAYEPAVKVINQQWTWCTFIHVIIWWTHNLSAYFFEIIPGTIVYLFDIDLYIIISLLIILCPLRPACRQILDRCRSLACRKWIEPELRREPVWKDASWDEGLPHQGGSREQTENLCDQVLNYERGSLRQRHMIKESPLHLKHHLCMTLGDRQPLISHGIGMH